MARHTPGLGIRGWATVLAHFVTPGHDDPGRPTPLPMTRSRWPPLARRPRYARDLVTSSAGRREL